MIRALFFDIDGTLVSLTTHGIPPSAVDAIRKAHERGIKVYISTGRPISLVNNIAPVVPFVDGYITFNGAYAFVGDDDIFCKPIPDADVQTMLHDAREHDYTVFICGKKDLAIFNHHKVFDEVFVEGLGVKGVPIYHSLEELHGQPILQLTPFFSVESEKVVMPKMTSSVSARWHPSFTDVTARGADKGAALQVLAAHEGFSLKECVAFGDGGNDISILQMAGVGVAMGNASEEVKQVANIVTAGVDDDGIAKAFVELGIRS